MNIGAKIRLLRKEKRVTQEELAEYYLAKIPALNFLFYEIAAAVKAGQERLENVQKAEDLCIDKLICELMERGWQDGTLMEIYR